MAVKNYGLIGAQVELESFTERLLGEDTPIGFDIETGYLGPDKAGWSLHPETAFVVGFSFTTSTDWARYVPLRHDVGPNLEPLGALRWLYRMLRTGRGVAHNALFELRHLSQAFRTHLGEDPEFGAEIRQRHGHFPVLACTQVQAYLLAEHQFMGLKWLVNTIFGHQMTELHELFPGLPKNKHKMLRFNPLDASDVAVTNYACEDAAWCLALHERNYPQIRDRLLWRVDMGIIECVCEMEEAGLLYDWTLMRTASESLAEFRDRYNAEIMRDLTAMTGEPVSVNLASAAQLGKMLFERLGYRTTVYTATTKNLPPEQRRMSTSKNALVALAKKHPVVAKIQKWKQMTKLAGTYLDAYESSFAYAADGRTHPSVSTALVITGRFAVATPPYQQSPKVYHFDLAEAQAAHEAGEDPEAGTCFRFNFRDAITSPPQHYILGFDLSQAELRAIAGEAGETALMDAFARGEDVHSLTAALMLGLPLAQITKDLRAIGKTLSFALLYGMSIKGLADRLGVSIPEAQELYAAYFKAFPNIAAWCEQQRVKGRRDGYVTSRFGRKLPIWEYLSEQSWIREKGDRACTNYPIQGAATGDYVRIAMLRARQALRDAELHERVHLVMNIHDALEYYVHESVHPKTVIDVLLPAVIFPVPGWPALEADWHIARRWGSPVELCLRDGHLVVKETGEDLDEPGVEFDEDGEEQVVLPVLDVELLRQFVGPTTPPPPHTVLISLGAMPQEQRGWLDFLELVRANPGPHAIVLHTPEGELPLEQRTSLGPEDTARISMLLGPASITVDAEAVDPQALVAGLSL